MSENSRSRNQAFFDYCVSVGLFDEQAAQKFTRNCSDFSQRELLFELAKHMQTLTASDFYDFSTRFYSNWLSVQQSQRSILLSPAKNSNELEAPHRHSMSAKYTAHPTAEQSEILNRKDSAREILSSPGGEEQEIEKLYTLGANKENEPKTNQRTQSSSRKRKVPEKQKGPSFKKPARNQPSRSPSSEKTSKLLEMYSKLEKKMADSRAHQSTEPQNQSSYRDKSPSQTRTERHSADVSPSSTRYNRLYEDHFNIVENKAMKWQIYRLKELSSCTFAPKTNQTKNPSKNLTDILQTPVFDRLTRKKPLKESLVESSAERRAMHGVTFSPNIHKSQASFKKHDDMSNSSLSTPKTPVGDRLYEKAEQKRQKLMRKRFHSYENEVRDLKFHPEVHTPTQDKRKFRQTLDSHVDRLYSEADRRKRNLAQKEGEMREKELAEYTFAPVSMTGKYNSKSSVGGGDPFTRLYGHAQKKQSLEREYEREINSRDSRRSPSISHSEKKSNRLSRSQSVTDTIRMKQKGDVSADFGDEGSVNRYSNISAKNRDSAKLETPAFDRLYNERLKRESKMRQLEAKVMQEQGISFKPKSISKFYKSSDRMPESPSRGNIDSIRSSLSYQRKDPLSERSDEQRF